MEICRSPEKATDGMSALKNNTQVCYSNKYKNDKQISRDKNPKKIMCKFCLRKHLFGQESCPAWGQKCRE